MRIYTSYYSKVGKDFYDAVFVQISTSSPSWFPYYLECLPEVYPGWDLVSGIKTGQITEREYTERYKAKLAHMDRGIVRLKLEALSEIYEDRDIILLCYEAPDKFCHRHILAEWLGNDVTEL